MDKEGCLYLFDVCGTLVNSDTTVGLLIWHFDRTGQSVKRLVVELLFERRSPLFWLVTVLERLFKCQFAKTLAVSLLKGQQSAELEASARAYARHLMNTRMEWVILEQLRLAQKHSQVILVSASLEPLVRALAEELGVEHVASRLSVQGRRLTGRYEEDITGRKLEALLSRYGEKELERDLVLYSDNFSDFALFEKCRERHVILRRARHRHRWAGLEAKFWELL